MAFRAKLYGRDRNPAVPVIGSTIFAVVELAAMDIGDEAEPPVIAGMIENDQTILAGARPQSAADCLDEPDAGFCRPGIDNTTDIRKV